MNIFAKKIQLKSVDWIFDLRHLQEILTVRVTILSNSIAGAMWKSNTKYWWKKMNNLSTLPLITETMIEEFRSNLQFLLAFYKHFYERKFFCNLSKWNIRVAVVVSWAYLVVVRTISGLLDAGVLFLVPHLHTDHWVHVESCQLPRLYHRDTHLKLCPKYTTILYSEPVFCCLQEIFVKFRSAMQSWIVAAKLLHLSILNSWNIVFLGILYIYNNF